MSDSASLSLGHRVLLRRQALGMTQRQLAEATKTSVGRVSGIESSRYPLATLAQVELWARALDVSPAWLAGWQDASQLQWSKKNEVQDFLLGVLGTYQPLSDIDEPPGPADQWWSQQRYTLIAHGLTSGDGTFAADALQLAMLDPGVPTWALVALSRDPQAGSLPVRQLALLRGLVRRRDIKPALEVVSLLEHAPPTKAAAALGQRAQLAVLSNDHAVATHILETLGDVASDDSEYSSADASADVLACRVLMRDYGTAAALGHTMDWDTLDATYRLDGEMAWIHSLTETDGAAQALDVALEVAARNPWAFQRHPLADTVHRVLAASLPRRKHAQLVAALKIG